MRSHPGVDDCILRKLAYHPSTPSILDAGTFGVGWHDLPQRWSNAQGDIAWKPLPEENHCQNVAGIFVKMVLVTPGTWNIHSLVDVWWNTHFSSVMIWSVIRFIANHLKHECFTYHTCYNPNIIYTIYHYLYKWLTNNPVFSHLRKTLRTHKWATKKTLITFHDTGWLVGILIMVPCNPYITG